MSFILDALRKSDAERQRAATPGLADVRYAKPRARATTWWLPILIVVLTANGLFMAVQWFGRSADQPAPEPVVQVQAPAPVAETPPLPDVRSLARESEFGEPDFEPPMEMERTTPPGQAMPEPAPTPMPFAEATAPVATAGARPSRIIQGDELPTAEQLIGAGTLNIPLLNLDLHVYSERPAGRFVVINTRKYKEGAQLTEGPTIESITINGVVLSSQGRRFTLPRK